MNLWALQTSRLSPNPCPLPWVYDYKVIPPSLSCSNWISLRDLLKLTSANATNAPPPKKKKKNSWNFQNISYSTMMPACKKDTHDGFVCLVAQLKSTSPVAVRSWGRRLSPQPRLRAGERCMLGQPGRQVAATPAGWARFNQGCGAQLELPTSAPLAHGWLKAKLRSACAWEWPWGESKQSVWKTPKRSSCLCLTSNGLYTLKEKILPLCHCCHLY